MFGLSFVSECLWNHWQFRRRRERNPHLYGKCNILRRCFQLLCFQIRNHVGALTFSKFVDWFKDMNHQATFMQLLLTYLAANQRTSSSSRTRRWWFKTLLYYDNLFITKMFSNFKSIGNFLCMYRNWTCCMYQKWMITCLWNHWAEFGQTEFLMRDSETSKTEVLSHHIHFSIFFLISPCYLYQKKQLQCEKHEWQQFSAREKENSQLFEISNCYLKLHNSISVNIVFS